MYFPSTFESAIAFIALQSNQRSPVEPNFAVTSGPELWSFQAALRYLEPMLGRNEGCIRDKPRYSGLQGEILKQKKWSFLFFEKGIRF